MNKNFIKEILDSPVTFRKEEDELYVRYFFSIGRSPFVLKILKGVDNNDTSDIYLGRKSKEFKSLLNYDRKEIPPIRSLQLWSTVREALKDYIKEHNPAHLAFTAVEGVKGLEKFYSTMLGKLADEIGYKQEILQYISQEGGEHEKNAYYLHRPDVVESNHQATVKQVISEILDNPGYDFHEVTGSSIPAYEFEFEGNRVMVDFQGGSEDYDVNFTVNNETVKNMDIKAMTVILKFWSTVKRIIKDFVGKHDPDSLVFLGASEELDRFYEKVLEELAGYLGMDYAVTGFMGMKVFNLVRKGTEPIERD